MSATVHQLRRFAAPWTCSAQVSNHLAPSGGARLLCRHARGIFTVKVLKLLVLPILQVLCKRSLVSDVA